LFEKKKKRSEKNWKNEKIENFLKKKTPFFGSKPCWVDEKVGPIAKRMGIIIKQLATLSMTFIFSVSFRFFYYL
jgi:hypothetical protein